MGCWAAGLALGLGLTASDAQGQPQQVEQPQPPQAAVQLQQVQLAQVQQPRDLPVEIQILQLREGVFRETAEAQQARFDRSPLLIDTSPELINLIDRAQEASIRGDWKLAVDSLQRVIDDPTGALLPCNDGAIDGGVLYESSRRYARRLLAELPPEGIRAYVMVYDGKARGLFEKAKAAHDVAGVRNIVDRYLLTSVGPKAADQLASWLLDEGRAGEALSVLLEIIDFAPENDLPQERVLGKLAAAYALLGRESDAAAAIAELQETDPGKASDWLKDLIKPEALALAATSHGGSHELVDAGQALAVNQSSIDLDPVLLHPSPWQYELPGGVENVWRRVFDDDRIGPLQLPVSEAVSDGERIFVRKRGGCAALSPDDLSPLWKAEISTENETARSTRLIDRQRLAGINIGFGQQSDKAAEDDAVKLISAGAGLVFVIEPAGTGEYRANDQVEDEVPQPGPAAVPGNATPIVTNQAVGSRLVALDAATGKVRWQRGRSAVADDVLSDVTFTSVPIVVGDFLWVPYLKRDRDFYVAVLDPSDGALVNTVLLGSLQEINRIRRFATPIGRGDGIVLVPSSYGTLFALDEADASLRWAAQYSSAMALGERQLGADSPWAPGPPVAAGGLVMLAPTDRPELLAFSAADGRFMWSVPAEQDSYLLAVGRDRFWLGGRGVTCRSVLDGKLIWRQPTDGLPTGRGILAGARILVPTASGVARFEAESGEPLGLLTLTDNQLPPGNLMALDPAVFTLDGTSIRRFPDVERSRRLARERHEADPGDLKWAIQLAWGELLAGEPVKACNVTDRFLDALEETSTEAESFRRVRIESLLKMAETTGSPQEALAWLELADQAAKAPPQKTRVRLAMAQQLQAAGRMLDAHRTLFELGLQPDADRVVSLADAVAVSIRFDVAKRLRDLRPLLSGPDAQAIDSSLTERVQAAVARLQEGEAAARRELLYIADLDPTGAAGKQALYAVGDFELRAQRYEWAEQYLKESVRRDVESEITLAAHVKLCEVYTAAWENAPNMLGPCLAELVANFGDRPVPPDPLAADEVTPASPSLIEQWAAQQRADTPAADSLGQMAGSMHLTDERLWSYGFDVGSTVPPRLVEFDGPASFAIEPYLYILGTDDMVECLEAGTRNVANSKPKLIWRTEMRLPGDFEHERQTFRELQRSRRAVIDGQIGIFNASDGIFGIGLVTGRRLWARSYDTPLDLELVPYRDLLMAARDGYVVAMPRVGWLTLMRSVDGSTVWERDLRGEPVSHMWLVDDRVLVADASLQRLSIFDRADGRLVSQVMFRQPSAESGLIELAHTGGVICGPDATTRSDEIFAVRIETGQEAWRVDLGKPVGQLFIADPGRIGVGLLGGDIRILDAATGETVLERRFAKGLTVTDGKLVDGTLLAQAERRHGQLRVPELVAIDVATGDEVWARADLAALQESPRPLLFSRGGIPAIIDSSRLTQGNVPNPHQAKNFLGLAMIDIKTGQPLGTVVELPSPNSGTRLNRDLFVRPGIVVVGTNKGMQAYRSVPVGAGGS